MFRFGYPTGRLIRFDCRACKKDDGYIIRKRSIIHQTCFFE